MAYMIAALIISVLAATILSGFLISFARAQDTPPPSDTEMLSLAVQYYDRCLETVYTDLPLDVRKEFCSCTSEKARDNLSAEEMNIVISGQGGRVDQIKLATEVMAPCLGYPMKQKEYTFCIGGRYRHFFKTQNAYEATCHCMADGAAVYLNKYGRDLMALLLYRNPKTPSPVDRLLRSPEYQTEIARLQKNCVNIYGYK